MRLPRLVISMILALAVTVTRAQDVSVRALLDTNKALIGDQINLRLVVQKLSADWHVDFPLMKDTLSKKIEIIGAAPIDTSEGGRVLTRDFLITVFDTGLFEIPALQFTVRTNDLTDTLSTLPVGFEVLSVKADSTIKDIKANYRVPVSFRELAPYQLGAIVLALLIWLLVYYIRRRKSAKPLRSLAISAEPPEVIALRELSHLKDEKPWMNNKVKYYYIRISEILRTYIEGHFMIQALEQTTEEIMHSLKTSAIDHADISRLSGLLRLSDLVKFAKVIPDPEQNALQIDQAGEFVRNTSLPKVTEEKEDEEVMVESIKPS